MATGAGLRIKWLARMLAPLSIASCLIAQTDSRKSDPAVPPPQPAAAMPMLPASARSVPDSLQAFSTDDPDQATQPFADSAPPPANQDQAPSPGQNNTANRSVKPPAIFNSARPYVPQTQSERARYYVKHMFSPESIFRAAAGAGINQALNTPSEWGQGGLGYGRRFASSYGNHIVQATTMYGLSAVFHEDNRYFASGETGFGPRLKYAIGSSFQSLHDDGTRHFSYSRMASYIAAALISRLWQPSTTRGVMHAASAFGVSVGAETGFNVAREFLPKIFHSLPPVKSNSNAPANH